MEFNSTDPIEEAIHRQDITCDGLREFMNKFPINGNRLTLLNMNIRSLSKNLDDFLGYLESENFYPDFLILTETFAGTAYNQTNLPGYTCFSSINPRNRNDGVVVYAKNIFQCSVTQVKLNGSSGIQINFQQDAEKFSLLCVYRSPARDLNNVRAFCNDLDNLLRSQNADLHCFLLGDLNLDLLNKQSDTGLENYLSVLHSNGYENLINSPTRIAGNSMTCLDHINVKSKIMKMYPAVIRTDITDHFATLLMVPISYKSTHVPASKESVSINQTTLGLRIEKINWDLVAIENDVNKAADSFVRVLKSCVEQATEIKRVKNKDRKLNPWMTTGILKSIRIRDRLRRRAIKKPEDVALKSRFLRYRNTVRHLIRVAKKQFFTEELDKAKDNPSKTWKVIKSAISGPTDANPMCPLVNETMKSQSTTIEDAKSIASNTLNQYFSQVGSTLASKFPNGSPHLDPGNVTGKTKFNIPLMKEGDLEKVLHGMRGGSAPGQDGISLKIIKNFISTLARPLLHIFNLSITSGIFPDAFKLAKVIPLYKGGGEGEPGNYRPISMLSVISKILEKYIKMHLYCYLESNHLLNANQYGFRVGSGVEEALYRLTTDLYNLKDNNKKGVLIMLDVAKAFDAINRDILFHRMERLGIEGTCLSWFKSYFKNRRQIVYVNGCSSAERVNDYGVIQGSTLGPLLFLIYMNNLHIHYIHTSLYMFADDTALLVEGKTWESTFENASETLKFVSKWFSENHLTLNTKKTKVLVYGQNRNYITEMNPKLYLHPPKCHDTILSCTCDHIDIVEQHKYLGVILDHDLNWRPHIDYVKNKLKKYVFIFYNIRNILPRAVLKEIYRSMVQSILQFGIVVWGGTYVTHLNKLVVLQKTILKIIHSLPRLTPSSEVYDRAKVYTVRQLFVKQLLLYYHKHPTIIRRVREIRYQTRFVNCGDIVPPRPRLQLFTHSPLYILHMVHKKLDPNMKQPERFSRNVYKSMVLSWLVKLGHHNIENVVCSSYTYSAL